MFISSTDLACYFASSNKLAVVQRGPRAPQLKHSSCVVVAGDDAEEVPITDCFFTSPAEWATPPNPRLGRKFGRAFCYSSSCSPFGSKLLGMPKKRHALALLPPLCGRKCGRVPMLVQGGRKQIVLLL